ncbi:MAG: sorbosone dehydrogenase family protein [Chitinophagaceae bacterium]|nr:sorbosone dehydrogenase family protein [Rubrivivax sp.]
MKTRTVPQSVVAAALAMAAGIAVAQQMGEQASAVANRYVPAQLAFAPSLLAQLQVPAGFAVTVFASGLGRPRMMETAPDGTVYVTRRGTNDVLALRDADGDGVAESQTVFAANLAGVHGIARLGSDLFLASPSTVWRTPLAAAAPKVVIDGLPDGGQHSARMVRFDPEGKMWLNIGSSCNDCAEENQLERGTLMRYGVGAQRREIVAKGLRNTIGFDWHPLTGALWGMDHGVDLHGDDVPPEELNEIKQGANYGWPICYGDKVVDPMTQAPPQALALRPGVPTPDGVPISRQAYCAQTEGSVLTVPAHSAPLAMRFYTGASFPAQYRNDAFVALRGSWNRTEPTGYKVVRLRFGANGRPVAFEDFVTGFLVGGGTSYFARLAGLVVAADGALLVSDDTNGVIYRISWRGF